MSDGYTILGTQLLVSSSPGSGDPFDAFEQSDDADWRRFEKNKFSIGDLLGVVPPYQVLQQQNAGLPPGSVPPWYAMQYPAGYVPPLLVSVDNPLEGDPFDNFDLLTRHHDEREQRDLRRSHLLGADPYDVANIQRAFNAVFRQRTLTVSDIEPLARLASKAIDLAIKSAPTGAFIPKQDTARQVVRGKINWHLDNLKTIRSERGPNAPYLSSDDFRKWAIAAFVECNAATSAAQYASERVSLFQEIVDQLNLVVHYFAKGGNAIANLTDKGFTEGFTSVAGIIPWWVWTLGGLVVVGGVGYLLMPVILPMLVRARAR